MAESTPVWLEHYEDGVPPNLDIPAATLPEILAATAAQAPGRTATSFMGGKLDYRTLARLVQRFAGALTDLGIKPGDRVALHLPNCPQFVIGFYGILQAGAVAVPINPLYEGDELALVLRDSGARTVLTLSKLFPGLAAVMEDLPAVEQVIVTRIHDYFPLHLRWLFGLLKAKKEGHAYPDQGAVAGRPVMRLLPLLRQAKPLGRREVQSEDLAVLQYTGGTTGVPKGAMLSHHNLVANVLQGRAWLTTLQEEGEIFGCALPFFHVYGLTVALNVPLSIGATLVLFPQFNPREVLAGLSSQRVTFFPAVPAMYVALSHVKDFDQYDLSSIRLYFSGAAPLPPEVKKQFEQLAGGRIVEGYGLTEASPITHANPLWGRHKTGSIGIPLPSTQARIVDLADPGRTLAPGEEGELCLRGPQVMQGYWNQPDETAAVLQDGWLYTGDIATMDEEGYFYIVDRKKDLVIVGGFNVYPREIEDLLYTHPKVQEAAVAGAPHPLRGEELVAYIVLRAGEEASRAEFVRFCREKLPAYKVPRRIQIVDDIPKTLVGKPLRRVIREREAQTGGARDGASAEADGDTG